MSSIIVNTGELMIVIMFGSMAVMCFMNIIYYLMVGGK